MPALYPTLRAGAIKIFDSAISEIYMALRVVSRFAALCPLFCTFGLAAAAITPPTAPSESVKVSLFASEPDIVTPIGATVDSQGRLLVIESITHFPTPKYKGRKADRIVMLQETVGGDKANRITTF